MTNLEELFEVFNGQDIDQQFQYTMDLIRKCRKKHFVEVDDQVIPLRNWLKAIKENDCAFRITYNNQSLALNVVQTAFKEGHINHYISVVSLVKSELMGCATAENFQTVKDLYVFWDNLEMSFKQMLK